MASKCLLSPAVCCEAGPPPIRTAVKLANIFAALLWVFTFTWRTFRRFFRRHPIFTAVVVVLAAGDADEGHVLGTMLPNWRGLFRVLFSRKAFKHFGKKHHRYPSNFWSAPSGFIYCGLQILFLLFFCYRALSLQREGVKVLEPSCCHIVHCQRSDFRNACRCRSPRKVPCWAVGGLCWCPHRPRPFG